MHVPGRSFARPGKLQAVRGYSLAVCVNFWPGPGKPFLVPAEAGPAVSHLSRLEGRDDPG